MNIYFTVRDACMKIHWFILAKRMTDGGFKELADGERTDGIARRSTVNPTGSYWIGEFSGAKWLSKWMISNVCHFWIIYILLYTCTWLIGGVRKGSVSKVKSNPLINGRFQLRIMSAFIIIPPAQCSNSRLTGKPKSIPKREKMIQCQPCLSLMTKNTYSLLLQITSVYSLLLQLLDMDISSPLEH